MSETQNVPGPVGGVAPEYGWQEPPGWPKVVGIISISWASLSLLCGVCGVGALLMLPGFLKQAEEKLGPMPDVMKPDMLQNAAAASGFIPAIILLIAGIATVGRKASGRTLHLVYAAIGLLLSAISIVISVQHQLAVAAWAQNNASDPWAKQAGSPFAWIGIGVGILLGLGWPAFCVIWFGVLKKRPDSGAPEVPLA